ncbi:MAG: sugar phosphate isomerase/epimerase [Clostridiales bacterium]|nr:sugar phosphate isomerase/epimerase [Clostridiales bacterium]
MKYGVWSAYFVELPFEEMVREFIGQGYDCSELSDEHGFALLERGDPIKVGTECRRYAEGLGFSFPQGHLWLASNICNPEHVDGLKKWLDLFNALGITSAVLHTGYNREAPLEAVNEARVKALEILTDYIKGTDLVICLENLTHDLSLSQPILDLINTVNSPNLAVCLDTGHLNIMGGDQYEFIKNCGNKLKALHIADNEGKTDQHMMPFGRGNVNWKAVVRGLKEVGYDYLFNLEIPGERLAPIEIQRLKLAYIKGMWKEICQGCFT